MAIYFISTALLLLFPVINGKMAEWFKAPVLKTGVGATNRRFESCFFRKLNLLKQEFLQHFLLQKGVFTTL
jgi:hypothetical protein